MKSALVVEGGAMRGILLITYCLCAQSENERLQSSSSSQSMLRRQQRRSSRR